MRVCECPPWIRGTWGALAIMMLVGLCLDPCGLGIVKIYYEGPNGSVEKQATNKRTNVVLLVRVCLGDRYAKS